MVFVVSSDFFRIFTYMRTVSRWSLFGLISLCCFASASCIVGDACAQWTNVAPNLVAGGQFIGAMQFKDGVVWAGANTLWSSSDLGKTWQQSQNFPNAQISDIVFYDKLHGLIATENQGLFVTIDGGTTWKNELIGSNLVKTGFDGSNTFLLALEIDGLIHISTDGGNTWGGHAFYNGTFHSFAVAQDGTIYVDGDAVRLGSVLVSTDLGNTWNMTAGTYNGDSWTLAVDSCNSKQLYLANEETQVPDTVLSNFYISVDGGQSWQTTDTHAKPYLSGSMGTTADGIFIGTEDGTGVHRSMDKGMTWKAIGGPDISSDTRNIALVNDNLILATDEQGSIWRTVNGGGDSVFSAAMGGLSLAPDSLFGTDSIECTPVSRTIQIVRGGCAPPSLDSTFILGPDSMSYQISNITNDSISVTLTPQHVGTQSAWLVGQLDNGTSDTVYLAGVGTAAHVLTLAASSTSEQEDTIGGTVNIPITIGGLVQPETVEMVLDYPLPDLQYVGSFDPSGTQVDVPGEQWPGRSLLKILNVQPGTVAAHARFNVFSDTDYDPVVTFDSVDVLSATSNCEYTLPPAVSTTIIPLEGCGIQMLSQWIHLGVVPLFSIIPNPSSGLVQITSTTTLGNVWVNVCDMLGNERGQYTVSLEKNVPATLTLPFESGLYLLRVGSVEGQADLHVLIEK